MEVRALDIEDIHEGQYVSYDVTITKEDVAAYAGLVGDISPLHVDEDYGKTTEFGGNLIHGMLLASHFSTMVGVLLPGRRGLLTSMSCDFKRAVPVGAEITVSGKVQQVNRPLRVMTLSLKVFYNNELCVNGKATVQVREDNR